MFDWSKGEPADIEDLVIPLKKILKKFYSLKRTTCKSAKWDGPLLTTSSILCGSYNLNEKFKKTHLDYDQERGRDALDVILISAIQLGIEQGYRLKILQTKHDQYFIQSAIDTLRSDCEMTPAQKSRLVDKLELVLKTMKTI